MTDLEADALAFLGDKWNEPFADTSDLTDRALINVRTLNTRIARGQALVHRQEREGKAGRYAFTGQHIVHNLIQDRLARYGFPVQETELAAELTKWVNAHIVGGEQHTKADVLLTALLGEGVRHDMFPYGIDKPILETSLVLPLGRMISILAIGIYTQRPEFRAQFEPR